MRTNTILTSPYTRELMEYAPGVDPTLSDRTIYPSISTSEKTLISIIGDKTYGVIEDLDEESPVRLSFIAALCNLVMYNYKIWETISKRQLQSQDTYRYELEAMQASYIDNYYSHIDDLVKYLEKDSGTFPHWTGSEAYKKVDKLLLKDAGEFNSFYGIDNSHYFFYSTIFIQQRVIDRHITPVLDFETLEDTHRRCAKSVVAQFTVAYALRQFDFIALPKSIRRSGSDGPSRSGKDEQEAVIDLSDFLFSAAQQELSDLIEQINLPADGGDVASTSDLNDERNKYFLM